MIKNYLLLVLIFLLAKLTNAQDIIVKTSGDEVKAKITEITLKDVVYKHPDSLQNLPATIPLKEVFMIKYANGTKEVLTRLESQPNTFAGLTPEELYARGQSDARLLYTGRGPLWGAAASSFLGGLLAIPVSVAIGAVPPQIKPTEVSDINLLQNQHYTKGYKKQAHKKKIGKVAAGTGIGIGTIVVLVSLIMSGLQ